MTIRVSLIALLLLSCIHPAFAVTPAPPAVRVHAVVGQVSVNGQPLRQGAVLPRPTTVSTGQHDQAALKIGLHTLLSLNHRSTLTLKADGGLRLKRGELWVEALSEGSRLGVELPGARLTSGSARINLQVRANRVQIDLLSGRAVLKVNGRRMTLLPGQRTVVANGHVGHKPAPDLANLTLWTESLRPREPKKRGDKEPTDSGIGTLLARIPGTRISRPLTLKRHTVRVVIRGSLVRTEIEELFENRSNRQLEGVYYFPLPPGASINRLAMEIKGKLVEGAIEEHKRARKIYEDIVRKMQDPALLEWAGGNTFKMRIFPIPKQGTKRLILAYTEQLPSLAGRYRYVYPMDPSQRRVGTFQLQLQAFTDLPLLRVDSPLYSSLIERRANRATLRFQQSNFRPRGDFVVNLTLKQRTPVVLSRSDGHPTRDPGTNYLMLRVAPPVPSPKTIPGARDVLLIVDTSASIKPSSDRIQKKLLRSLLLGLPDDIRFNVMRFDYRSFSFNKQMLRSTPGNRMAALRWLESVRPGGATDLKRALSLASQLLKGARNPRIFLISDGISSSGEIDDTRLLAHARKQLGSAQLFSIAVGNSYNELLLSELSRQHAGLLFTIGQGDPLDRRIVQILSAGHRPLLTDLKITLPEGLQSDRYPKKLANLRRGEEFTLVARSRKPLPERLTLKLSGTLVSGTTRTPWRHSVTINSASATTNRLVPRVWAQKRIRTLMLDGGSSNIKEIVRLSKAYGIMTRYTAFLVLDSKEAFKRFSLKQRELEFKKQGIRDPSDRGPRVPVVRQARVVLRGGSGLMGRGLSMRLARRRKIVIYRSIVMRNGVGIVVGQWRYQLRKRSRSCMHDPDTTVRMKVTFNISARKRIRRVRIAAKPEDRRLVACVKRIFLRFRGPSLSIERKRQLVLTLRLDPNSGSRKVIAVLKQRLRDRDRAKRRKALQQLIGIYQKQKNHALAVKLLARLVRRFDRAYLLKVEAGVRRNQGKTAEADRLMTLHYRIRLAAKPDSARLRRKLCQLLERRRLGQPLLDEARVWIRRSPKKPQPHFWAAKALKLLGRTNDAHDASIRGYYVLLKQRKLNRVGRKKLYRLLDLRNRSAEKRQLIFNSGSIDDLRQLLAQTRKKTGLDAATRLANQAIRLRPLMRQRRKLLVELLLQDKKYRRALHAALQWRRYDRENVNLIRTVGDLQRQLGRQRAALRTYSEMVELRPKEAEGHRKLALVLKSRGKLVAAYEHMSLARQIRPKQPWIHFALGDLAQKLGRLKEAERHFRRVVGGKWPSRFREVVFPAKDRLAMLYLALRRQAVGRRDRSEVQRIDQSIRKLGLDQFLKHEIRISMYWDTDDTDVDLWVIDPTGEKVYYSHKRSKIGGRLYADITSGYGPELFTLTKAVKGSYKVIVHYYGGSNSAEESRGEVMVVLFPGTPRESIKTIPYVLTKESEKKSVFSFTIR